LRARVHRARGVSAPSSNARRLLARDHAARCRVLSRPGNNHYRGSLRPCIAWCSRPRTSAALPDGALVRALIFDLDGTLVDTVYAHVFAWQRALAEAGLAIDGWKIHRRIGMSGGLFARAVAREVGRPLSDEEVEAVQQRHGELFRELLPERRPLPGAVRLLAELRELGVAYGI